MRRLVVLSVMLLAAACGKDSSPTAPTPAPSATKVIRLVGTLNFGSVGAGQTPPDSAFSVNNDGNAILSVTGVSGPCGGSALNVIGSTTFGVAPQQSVMVTVRFRPTTVQN